MLEVTHASYISCAFVCECVECSCCIVTNTVYMHVTQDRWTALHLAAQEGHEDVVELLLEAKADPELKTKVISIWTSVYSLHTYILRVKIE